MFTVNVTACTDPDHDACSVHVCTRDDGAQVWESHAPDHISDEARLNVTELPTATKDGEEITWNAPTPADAAAMGLDVDDHRVLTTLGAVLEHRPLDDIAATSGIPAADLVAEAEGWAAAG